MTEPVPRTADIFRGHRNQFFLEAARPTSRITTGIGAFVNLAVLGLLAAADYPLWRIGALGVAFALFSGVQFFIICGVEKIQHVDRSFLWMNAIAQGFVVTSAVLTGGMHSPAVPGLVLPAIISLLFFGPQPISRWIAAGNASLIVALAFLPSSVVGPTLPHGFYVACLVVNLTWNLFVLHHVVGRIAVAASRTGDSITCLRNERVSEAEAQLRRLQSVGAKVAHELKNPLASIKGLCQLVARAPESERTRERLAVVASEITRMESILTEYLSFSRPLEDLQPGPVDLAAVARDVLDVLGGRAEQAGVALKLDARPTPITGDARRIKEALINLVANAVEATAPGGTVEVATDDDGKVVTLEVRDNGRGISPEHLDRLGTSFFTTREEGTGLGVVLAQGVIAQHGGQLRYASTLGEGTTVTITLPSAEPPAAAPLGPDPAPRAALVEARA